MSAPASRDYAFQQRLIQALHDPVCYPDAAKAVRLVETHISWVLLAGRYAYKIKKAVDLGFLDFTSLDARRFCCEEEIRLNRRLAPQIYLDVIPVGGTFDAPRLSKEPAVEYAVRMRRFPVSRTLDRLLARGALHPEHIDRLAETVARFHAGLPPAPAGAVFGTPQTVREPAVQNFDQLAPLLETAGQSLLEQVRAASMEEYAACASLFDQRRRQGWVRECHGDLHSGNIVLLGDAPTPFDGIEFNAGLRWIDVISEVAFLAMDLTYRGNTDLAWRFLDGYLQLTGDYAGAGVLRYYLAYRAMVRAKIAAIRASQPDTAKQERRQSQSACQAHMELAAGFLQCRRPALVITHGLPGCGKSTVAQLALQRLQAIRIRSDVERKRLYGLAPLQASRSQAGDGIYSAEATRRTYARLLELADSLLASGYGVIVDAAFLKRSERGQFHALARARNVPFVILDVCAEPAILRARVARRHAHGMDASEADLHVLETLLAIQEPLQTEERHMTVTMLNNGDLPALDAQAAAWEDLQRRAAGKIA